MPHQEHGGYTSLESALRGACNPTNTTTQGLVLAYILSSDYTVLQTLSNRDLPPYPSDLPNQSKDLVVRHPDALNLLFTLLDDGNLHDTVYRILLGAGPTLCGLRDRVVLLLKEEKLSPLHLAILRKTLEAGIKPCDAYTLFRRVIKKNVPVPVQSQVQERDAAEEAESSTSGKKSRPQLKLDLSPLTIAPSPAFDEPTPEPTSELARDEVLEPDNLETIRHAMRFRSPPAHHFRPGRGASLVMKETGKQWPSAARGYLFYVSSTRCETHA